VIIGVDTDVLVNWAMQGAPHHHACRDLIASEVRRDGNLIGVTTQTILEFLHIGTDPRRFERPLSMAEGFEWARALWNAREVVRIMPKDTVVLRTVELMEQYRLGRKRILDTALAATLEAAGVRRLATLNVEDFEVYSFIEVVSPLKR
jgi:predicted nucleic acid-binding protein